MKGKNLDGAARLRWVPITGVVHTVAAGAAGWVDTDVSATTGTDTGRAWLVICAGGGALDAGCRAHGEVTDTHYTLTYTAVSRVDPNGHMDLHRSAGGDIPYAIMGYLDAD